MDSDQLFWDMAFCSLVGIQYHPANPPEGRVDLEELADVVDRMMDLRVLRSLERAPCP